MGPSVQEAGNNYNTKTLLKLHNPELGEGEGEGEARAAAHLTVAGDDILHQPALSLLQLSNSHCRAEERAMLTSVFLPSNVCPKY